MTSIDFLSTIITLKRIPRSGWITHGISQPDVESVADHTFSVSSIALLLTDLELRRGVRVNAERVLRMVILHDLAEALTFDISKSYLTYIGKRGSVIKSEIEGSAWKHITRGIGSVSISSEYAKLQEQYVSNATIEAQIVHVADSLDILLQILELRRRGYPASLLEELWNEGVRKVKNTPVYSARQLLNSVKRKEKGLRTK